MEKITASEVSLPKGGGAIKGIGETFQPNPFTGTANFSIPLYTSPCRKFEPKLSLAYSSGTGNSPFGAGFDVTVPSISRKTEKSIPRYDDSDTFVLSGAEDLVPLLVEDGDRWIPGEKELELDGVSYLVKYYRPRVEGLFAQIEFWQNLSTRETHWEVTTKDSTTHVYGRTENSRIADPEDTRRVFRWFLEESSDARGNKVRYTYKAEDDTECINDLEEVNRFHTAHRYLKTIQYGNYVDANGQEQWTFQVVFDYGEHDVANDSHLETLKWPKRQDSFSSFRAGFEIRTHRLCRRVMMFHQFPELGDDPCLVRSTEFEYDENPTLTNLKSVKQVSYRKTGEAYETAEMPPIELSYSSYNPAAQEFKPLQFDSDTAIPGLLNQAQFLLIDLYGEGIPGILYNDGSQILYWRGKGNAMFDSPVSLHSFPSEQSLGNRQYSIQDLGGDGVLDLVVHDSSRPGFYEMTDEGAWENFIHYRSYPLANVIPQAKLQVDVNGDGLSDVIVQEDSRLTYYLSKGKEGYDVPVSVSTIVDDDHFPPLNGAAEDETLLFANVFGDGMAHPIRIRNGIAECWPNLGYGRFGKKIIFKNSPRVEGIFDPSRLFIADVDGSGTADLLYVYHDHIDLFLNQSGNAYSDPVSIYLAEPIDNLDQISVADVLGSGTSCLVISKQNPGQQSVQHDYYDFSGGTKPHLLTQIKNNLGATTAIEYSSSTQYSLDDRASGKPWVTTIPFPVHVIAKTEIIDEISGTRLVSRYAYHHGYYDREEKEFRGFGSVERWDAESFDEQSDGKVQYVPPVYTKTWYHTGAYVQEGIFSRQFETEYYSADAEAHLLEDTVLENAPGFDEDFITEAYRALKGQKLREEVYAEDDLEGISEHPYVVTEANFSVRMIQPNNESAHAVFYVYPSEAITYSYERNPDDPRIQHQFTLEVDDYGNVLKSCTVWYPRRENADAMQYDEQRQLSAIVSVNQYINETESFYRLGIPYENKTYEIGGLALSSKAYFTFDELSGQAETALEEANSLRNDQELDGSTLQSRLLSWARHYYWNDGQDSALSLGQTTALSLLHHSQTAVFSEKKILDAFGEKVTESILEDEGGYVKKDGYWWNPGLIQHYADSDQFYLPTYTEDVFGSRLSVTYDDYALVIVQTEDALGNTTSAEVDYNTLMPEKITGINDNVSEAIFDSLGMVRATSVFGSVNGETKGDTSLASYTVKSPSSLTDILDDAPGYLQEATTYFYYDLFAWKDRGEPPFAVSLAREIHVSDLEEGEETPIQINILFSDGFGRTLQQKLKVEAGRAFVRDENGELKHDEDGQLIEEEVEERWLVSGRTVYNNKGKPYKQYEPFYSATASYESESELTEYGVTPVIQYDPLLRVVRTDTPKGFFSKVEISPWEIASYDQNDTVKDSDYYQRIINDTSGAYEDETQALKKAEAHYGTPQHALFNNRGQQFITISSREEGEELVSYFELDVLGNHLRITDPRQGLLDEARSEADHLANFEHVYDMQGNNLYIKSQDAGERWTLTNLYGNSIHSWNSRGYHVQTSYDLLQRPIEVTVDGNGLDNVVEKLEYGEGATDDKQKNLRGQLIRHYDQAGVIEMELYDFKGQPLQKTRQLRTDYKDEVNWESIESVELEDEKFTTEVVYDALGRIRTKTNPDGSVVEPEFHPSGLLNRVNVTLAGETDAREFVQSIEYNAKGQRVKITYGNGTYTEYDYEKETFRLTSLKTYRSSDGKLLQDISYVYDPVGNIVKMTDKSHESVFSHNQVSEPSCLYEYDALYQLTEATGREHPALGADDYADGFKQSQFLSLNDTQQLQNYTRSFTYDEAGNLTKIQHTASDSVRSFTREMKVSETSNRAVLLGEDASVDPEDSFDENGNMTQLSHLEGINWNYRDHIGSVILIEREDAANDAEYYVYDSSRGRIRKVKETLQNSGSTTEVEEKFYVDGIEIKRIKKVAESSTTLLLERYTMHIMDDKRRIALAYRWTVDEQERETDTLNESRLHYHYGDHLSSSSLELNEEGEIISYEEYFPYGDTSLIAGDDQTEVSLKEYRYTGKEQDDSTSLYYFGARYYAPWMGRWMSCDPKGKVDGLNLYNYAKNNPIVFIDKRGNIAVKLTESVMQVELYGYAWSVGLPVSREVTVNWGTPSKTRADLMSSGVVDKTKVDYEELKLPKEGQPPKYTKQQVANDIPNEPKGKAGEIRGLKGEQIGLPAGTQVKADVRVTTPENLGETMARIETKAAVREALTPVTTKLAISDLEAPKGMKKAGMVGVVITAGLALPGVASAATESYEEGSTQPLVGEAQKLMEGTAPYELYKASVTSYEQGSLKPLGAEAIRQGYSLVGSVLGAGVGAVAGAFIGGGAGLVGGGAATVETGPGAVGGAAVGGGTGVTVGTFLGGALGAMGGGYLGYELGDYLADKIYPN